MIDTEPRSWIRTIAFFLLASVSFLMPQRCMGEHGYVLTQSPSTEGTYKVSLCKSGIRIERDGSKAFLIAKQPTWRVVFYNPVNAKAIDMTYDQWIHHESYWTPFKPDTVKRNESRLAQPIDKSGQVMYADRMCGRYKMRASENGVVAPGKSYWGEIYGLAVPNIPMPPIRILEKLFEIPPVDALPLFGKQFIVKDRPNAPGDPRSVINLFATTWHLSTASIAEKEVSEKLFVYPTKFAVVRRECDVLLDDSLKRKGSEAFEFMGEP